MNKILILLWTIFIFSKLCFSQEVKDHSSSAFIIYPVISEKGFHERKYTRWKSISLAFLIDSNDKLYFTSVYSRYLTEEGGYDRVYGFTYQHEYIWDYITFKLGGSIALTPYFPIPLPNLGTRIGWPDKFYLDINI